MTTRRKIRPPKKEIPLTEQQATLVEQHYQMVKTYVETKWSSIRYNDKLDLEHCGVIGLIQAAKKYDPSKKVKFGSYARYRVAGEIVDQLRRNDGPRGNKNRGKIRPNSDLVEPMVVSQRDEETEPAIAELRENFFKRIKLRHGRVLAELATQYWVDRLTLKKIGAKIGVSEARISQRLRDVRTFAHIVFWEELNKLTDGTYGPTQGETQEKAASRTHCA